MPWLVQVHDLPDAVHGADFMRANNMRAAQHGQHTEKRLGRTSFIVAEDIWRMRQNAKRRIPQCMQAKALHERVELVLYTPPAILEIVVIKAQAGVNKTFAQP